MSEKITRVTMFKIPARENQEKMAGLYQTLFKTAVKDGKPYVRSVSAGPAADDARCQGFTFIAITTFDNKADMAYYDADCEAHKALKVAAKDFGLLGPPSMVYFTPTVIA